METLLFFSLAFADDPKPAAEAEDTAQETVVEQAVHINEQLSEILARVEELKSAAETDASVESQPVKRVEATPETK